MKVNASQAQYEFFEAAIKLQLNQGHNVISRKSLVQSWLALDPQKDYGTGVPFGASASHAMMKVAKNLGGTYISEKGRNANARIEF